jgi:hypothetical protein
VCVIFLETLLENWQAILMLRSWDVALNLLHLLKIKTKNNFCQVKFAALKLPRSNLHKVSAQSQDNCAAK